MKPRELTGAINRAKQIYVWCTYAPDHGIFLAVSKPTARLILDAAKAIVGANHRTPGIDTVASLDAGDLYIGAPATKIAREEEE
jgi:hypothetical protein